MGPRFGAFFAVAFGGAFGLFGALYGQGVLGHGMLFGALGPETVTEGTILAFVMATATIVFGVLLMFIRETRPLAALIATTAVVGTLAAGTLYGVGAILALVGVVIALRLDRKAPLV